MTDEQYQELQAEVRDLVSAAEEKIAATEQLVRYLRGMLERMYLHIFDWQTLSGEIASAYDYAIRRYPTADELAGWRVKLLNGTYRIADVHTALTHYLEYNPRLPVNEPVHEAKLLRGNFMWNEAHGSTHYWMSEEMTDAERRTMIMQQVEQGANVLSIMPWYCEDYNGARFPVNYHSSTIVKKGFTFGTPYPDTWIHWMQVECRSHGIEPIIWMMTDDAMPHMDRNDINQVKARWEDFIVTVAEPLQLKWLIIGLEALEYWTTDQVRELGNWLKNRCPWADIGFHTLPGDQRLIREDFFHTLWYQYSELERVSGATIADATRVVIRASGKRVIAAEYCPSGWSALASRFGQAALGAGADGAINGF